MNTLFPIFLKVDQLRILVVGGGPVALEKLHFLHKSSPGACIDLVAISVLPEIHELLGNFAQSSLFLRGFSVEDLQGKHIVIAATNNAELNFFLRDLADKYHFLLNVADKPELCDFYLGGVVTRGDLKLAISTNGRAPVLAKRMREFFEDVLPDTIESTLQLSNQARQKIKGTFAERSAKLNALTSILVNGQNSD